MSLVEKFHKIRKEVNNFNKIFYPLRLGTYHDLITGFNVVQFDIDIKTPDGVSCKEWVEKEYGKDAVNLIKRLL